MPDNIKNMNIFQYLSDQLVAKGYTGNDYKQRLLDELNEYKSRNMLNVIKFLKHLMDTCMANNVVSGIGRGSSVSSLVLHLLDVHYIDPVKYNLDYKEFLR
jgi:DNA polymerase III alpha subunit